VWAGAGGFSFARFLLIEVGGQAGSDPIEEVSQDTGALSFEPVLRQHPGENPQPVR
jgi:hypothetical protein